MYAGVDIGGTKTLVAVLDDDGVIQESRKFPTPHNYQHFILELQHAVAFLATKDFKAAGVAIPGRLDRKHGRALKLGNLPWSNVPVQADCEKIFHCPVVIENDANLAALSEAMVHKKYHNVLYVTISTGIGTGFISDKTIVPSLVDGEGGHMILPHNGKLEEWESFASGRAIFEHYGKKAANITDQGDWKTIARNLALGLFEHIALLQPDVIIIGGSVGTYFEKYGKYLKDELDKYAVPVVPIPPVVAAKRPEVAVIYGCYDLARQKFNHGQAA
jgi:predicted NBD/HSP70 family sugar kinase